MNDKKMIDSFALRILLSTFLDFFAVVRLITTRQSQKLHPNRQKKKKHRRVQPPSFKTFCQ